MDPVARSEQGAFHGQWNLAEVGRFLWDGKPIALETVEAVLLASERSFAQAGYGLWSVRLDSPSALTDPVGFCGLRVPEGRPDPEILYALDPSVWGRGYAIEAASAVLRYAFESLTLARITAGTNPGNAASWRVLERVGLRRTGLVHTEIEDLYTYEVTREEFLATRLRPKDPA
ncbi:MAG TPA: GNAT family N-acetyltransferase [Vicinamibacteria bacterium]